MTIDKTYQPEEVETRHYEAWERSGAFACGGARAGGPDAAARPFTIVIPPPNVTGSLHMGHALNNTLQDILTRYWRLRGRDALWQPGTDHAGIATQMVVERQLADEGKTRHDLGRDGLIERIWEWKAESGGTITEQLRRLGASCDWSRERFTMDDGLSQAVRKVFVTLYKEGLIYRDKRLVNWDPKLHTAISDLEVEQREEIGKLWYFKYPVEGADGVTITVATTRPETMLGDTAVAVHPDDDRYRDLVGKNVLLPIVGRVIPIVADEYSDPEKGSGAVKITPAHDFNDFEVGRRHDLPMINVFDINARLNEDVPEHLRGLDRFEARERVVDEMDGLGLLEKIEDNPMTVPYGDRSGVVIEPYLTDQWYVDAVKLAGPAIKVVESGATRFVPQRWENTFFHWMRNIQPWCISRQIWWGHQIPAWYAPDGRIFVEETEDAALKAAHDHYGHAVTLSRDPDVLDTWFSSALWPFSTLGWPEDTPEVVKRYYPTDVLVTGFDIIFFWVARMMMMGLHFMKEVPFHTVYIHGLVLDAKGKKMSKTAGNVVDPLEEIEQHGADVLRFSLCSDAAQRRNIRWSPDRVSGARYFVTKLWNAARYAQMNGCAPVTGFDPATCKQTVNRWIVGEVARAQGEIDLALEDYRFSDAALAPYHFTWNTFCDWYLEFTKPILDGEDAAAAAETRATTAWVLDQILHLLHPFMPFVTEELWELLAPESQKRQTALISSAWPALGPELENAEAKGEMDWVVRVISEVRAVRTQMNVPDKARIAALLKDADDETSARLARNRELILRLARLDSVLPAGPKLPSGAVQAVIDGTTLILPLGDVIDIDAEKARLKKGIAAEDAEIAKIEKKLANEKFIANAPAEVIEEQRERLARHQQARAKLQEALDRLSAA